MKEATEREEEPNPEEMIEEMTIENRNQDNRKETSSMLRIRMPSQISERFYLVFANIINI